MKKLILVLLAVLLTFSVAACTIDAPSDSDIDIGNKDSFAELPPDDGTAPENYSSEKNMAYIAGALSAQKNYESVTTGKVSAGVFGIPYNQGVFNKKTYKDGKLLTMASSTSTFVNVAEEKYFTEKRVLLRRQTNKSKIKGENTVFEDGAPSALSYDDYDARYGLVPNGLTDYLINEETLLSASEVTKVDGKYVLNCSLEPTKSTIFYRRQVKTMASSSGYPIFKSVDVKFTFDESWRILKINVAEVYDIDMMGGITCTGELEINYTYGSASDGDFDYYAEYEQVEVEEDKPMELTAATCITEGFEDIISGVKSLKIGVQTPTADYCAYVKADMANSEFKIKFGALNFSYKNGLYFNSEGVTYKLDIEALLKELADENGNVLGIELPEEGQSLDTDALLDALSSGVFTHDKENGKASLSATLELFGLEIPLEMAFNVPVEGKISLESINGTLAFGEANYLVFVQPCDADDKFEVHDYENAHDMTASVSEIAEVIKGNYIDVSLGLQIGINGTELNIQNGHFYIDRTTDTVYVCMDIVSGEFTYVVSASYVGGKLYVTVDDDKYVFGGNDVEIIKKLIDDISKNTSVSDVNIDGILNVIATIGNGIDISVFDFDKLIESLIVSICAQAEKPIEVSAMGITVKVDYAELSFASDAREFNINEEEYMDLTSVVQLATEVLGAYEDAADENGDAAFVIDGSATLDLKIGELSLKKIPISARVDLAVDKDNQVQANVRLSYDYYYFGLGLMGTMIICGDSTVDIAIRGDSLYIARHQTSYGKKSWSGYKETECDEWAYMYTSLEYSSAHYMDIIGFIFNLGDSIKSTISSSIKPAEPKPAEKVVISNYLKSYSFADNVYGISISGAAILGDNNIGDINIKIGRNGLGQLTTLYVDCTFVSIVNISLDLVQKNLTEPTNHADILAVVSATADRVKGSGTEKLVIERTAV